MIGIQFIKFDGWMAPRGMKREFQRIRKEAHRIIGKFWHKRFLPDHFKMKGYAKYGYKPRQGQGSQGRLLKGKRGDHDSYSRNKGRAHNHQLPLVFSGVSRDQALREDVRANSNLTRIVLNAPKLNFRQPNGPNMVEEVTRILPSESEKIEALFEKEVTKGLNKAKIKLVQKP